MSKKNRLILFGTYVLLGLLIEELIFWLFPYTGLGGLICYPIALFLSLAFGFSIYKIATVQTLPWHLGGISIILLVIQFCLQLGVHPQDFGGSVFKKISDFSQAYRNYEVIRYDKFTELSNAEKVVFYYKFQDRLPNSFTTLGIDTDGNSLKYNPRLYLIENKDGQKFYDTTKLKIIELDTATIIIENPNDVTARSYKTNRNFMNNEGGGYGDDSFSLHIEKDHFELDTGIKKIFYFLLNLTKKPTANIVQPPA